MISAKIFISQKRKAVQKETRSKQENYTLIGEILFFFSAGK